MADVTRGQNNQDQDWELQFLDGGSIDDDLAQFGERICTLEYRGPFLFPKGQQRKLRCASLLLQDELIVNALKVGGGDLLQYARKVCISSCGRQIPLIAFVVSQWFPTPPFPCHLFSSLVAVRSVGSRS
eukprot:300436-Rhodomonas_salina.1